MVFLVFHLNWHVCLYSALVFHMPSEVSGSVTLSPARILKLSMTCSAVSVSVDSRVMKSRNASNDT